MNREELEQEYDRHYIESPFKWDNEEKNRFCADIAHILLADSAGIRMLDVGCGSGKTLEVFNQRFPAWSLYGFDLSNESLQLTRSRVPTAILKKGMLGDTLFDIRFNFIAILGVLEHIEDIAWGLKQLDKLLEAKGFLYIEVPNCISYDFSEKTEGFRRLNGGSRQIEWHLYRKTWEHHITESGLHIIANIKGFRPWIEFIWIVSKHPLRLHKSTLSAIRNSESAYLNGPVEYSQKRLKRMIQNIIGPRLTQKIRSIRSRVSECIRLKF